MLLLNGIIFYLFFGSNNFVSACFSKSKSLDEKIKNFNDAMWRFETEFVQNIDKSKKSKFVYSPHSAAITLLAIAFGGEIKCRLAKPMHLNLTDLRLPLSGSSMFGAHLREFVRLGHVGTRGNKILTTVYTNRASKKCKIQNQYKDILEQLRITNFLVKGSLSSKILLKSTITDNIEINIADFAKKCLIRKSSRQIEFRADNVREGTLESLNGAKFYSLQSTDPDIAKSDKVRLIFILPLRKSNALSLKKNFSQLKYSELLQGSKKSFTFSMSKPSKISQKYDFKMLLSKMNIQISRKYSNTIFDNFNDICPIKDEFSMHGYQFEQTSKIIFDSKKLDKETHCSKEERKINVRLRKGTIALVVAQKTILVATTI